ncbi:MAG: molybdopterin-dependent oxidoreductase, partial [Rhodocyclaceae bacterium]
SDNIDFRLRQSDFSVDGPRAGAPWLGMRIAELGSLDRVLIVGSFLRKDHPLIAQRLRQSAKKGAQISLLHATDDELFIKLHAKAIAAPAQLPALLAEVVKAAAELKSTPLGAEFEKIGAGDTARKIAASLVSGTNAAILLGNFAQQHPQAATLHRLAQQLAALLGGRFGFLGEAANSVGGYVAGALPRQGGMDARRLVTDPRRAYLLVGVEPELDCADGAAALAAMRQAASVIMMTPFKSQAALDYADCLLPVAPFTETSGTFVNTEGRAQSFFAVCKPLGETRPGWKVLRVLGNLLELQGFEYESSEQVRDELLGGKVEFVSGLDNAAEFGGLDFAIAAFGLQRIADVPIHFADPLVRRAPSLQATHDAAAPTARMNAATLAKLGLTAGTRVKVGAGATAVELLAELDAGLPDDCVRIAAAHASTVAVGPMFGNLNLERA